MRKNFCFILIVLNNVLFIIVDSCRIFDMDSNNCKENKYLSLEDFEFNSVKEFSTEKIFDGFKLILGKLNKEFHDKYNKALLESKKDLSFINNIPVDKRISDYITNNNFLGGEEIKNGVIEILKNYNEKDTGSISRIIHSELLNNNVANQGFINLVLIPNEV